MKKFLPIIVLLAVAAIAQASDYHSTPATITNSPLAVAGTNFANFGSTSNMVFGLVLTNTVAAATSNNQVGVTIPCKEEDHLILSFRTKLAGAGTSAINLLGYGTVDGTNFESVASRTIVITPTGTLTVQTVTNLDTRGFGAIAINAIQNPNASDLTNLQFDVGYKKPGPLDSSP